MAVVRLDMLNGLQQQLHIAQEALKERQEQPSRGTTYTLEEAVAVIQTVAQIARSLQATSLPSSPPNGGYDAAAGAVEPPPAAPLHNPFAALLGRI